MVHQVLKESKVTRVTEVKLVCLVYPVTKVKGDSLDLREDLECLVRRAEMECLECLETLDWMELRVSFSLFKLTSLSNNYHSSKCGFIGNTPACSP